MATGSLYGSTSESTGLYGIGAASGGTYFEWFIFQDSATAPATPTGGSWSFSTNTGTAPSGWVASPPPSPVNQVWVSIAIVDSRNASTLVWSVPGLLSSFGSTVANYITFVATSAVTLSGILGASTTPLMVLNDIGISLGTSTTADNLNDYFGSLGLATNPELLPYARITIDTGLGYYPDSCKILYFDLVECFKYLVIPTADTGVKLYGVATTSIFSLPPFSWAYNFFDILGSDSTTSLPAVVLIVPNGIPGAGKSLDLSPWKAMRDFWLYVPSGNFITAATTSSIYEVTKPIFNVAYLLIFGFWFFLIVIKFKP